MSILTLNWIKFFHKAHFSYELMQNIFNCVSKFSPETHLAIEDCNKYLLTSSEVSLNIIKSLEEAGLCMINPICPYCGEIINIDNALIMTCESCEQEINISMLPIAKITKEASLIDLFKEKYDDAGYEINAELVLNLGTANKCLYYLITDIEDSQTRQEADPNQYSSILSQLWSGPWHKVLHGTRKASLPLLARGDAVSWVFVDWEDLLNAIREIVLFLNDNFITRITAYAGDISIPNAIKNPLMRSIDKKWDLNTPSVTDLYRKAEFKPPVWKVSDDYLLKYCLFDTLSEIVVDNTVDFFKNGVLEKYSVDDKHHNHYEGNCFVGCCRKNDEGIKYAQL
jgi:hypothetical protein